MAPRFVFTTEISWKGRDRLPSMVFLCKYDNDTAGWLRRRVERSTINEHDMLALHLNINVAWWTRKWRFFDELSSGDYRLWIDPHFFFFLKNVSFIFSFWSHFIREPVPFIYLNQIEIFNLITEQIFIFQISEELIWRMKIEFENIEFVSIYSNLMEIFKLSESQYLFFFFESENSRNFLSLRYFLPGK